MTSTVKIGSTIDHYKILEKIGKGGMGIVFKALNVHLDKVVAIKTIALGLAAEENFTDRFRIEARALAKLHDPNIVSIYDLRADDNQWYIVMEYVEGITLAKMIREMNFIPWQRALNIFKQMLSAIGHAHRASIIHRDIKPNNVMITKEGSVKITDFGLAKDQKHSGQTIAAATGGTLHYMSPEQVKGLIFTDHRSDIYSLGLTLYEMLAGKIPFRKDDTDFSIREAIIKRQFPPPTQFNPHVPSSLNGIVMKAIEKKPEDRFQTVSEMMNDIEKYELDHGIITIKRPKRTYLNTTTTDISLIAQQYQDISSYPPPAATDVPADAIESAPKKSTLARTLILTIIPIIILLSAFSYFYFYIIERSEDDLPMDAEIEILPKETEIEIADTNQAISIAQMEKEQPLPKPTTRSIAPSLSRDIEIPSTIEAKADTITVPLKIDSDPSGATIYLDDEKMEIGSTPFVMNNVPQGKHKITLEREGYSLYSTQIIVSKDKNNTLHASLNPIMSDIQILVKPWGSIVVDGSLKVQNTNVKYSQQLNIGKHTLKIFHPTFGTWEKSIDLKKDTRMEILVDFNKFVSVPVTAFDTNGTPIWAEIIIDNSNTGETTPREIDVRVGYRTIAARKEGYILVNGEQQMMFDENLKQPLKFILRKVM